MHKVAVNKDGLNQNIVAVSVAFVSISFPIWMPLSMNQPEFVSVILVFLKKLNKIHHA